MNDGAMMRRGPPNNQDAEQSVIGAMILDRAAIKTAAEILTEDDFYYRQLGTMFAVMIELEKEESAVDPVTLQNRLREKLPISKTTHLWNVKTKNERKYLRPKYD